MNFQFNAIIYVLISLLGKLQAMKNINNCIKLKIHA